MTRVPAMQCGRSLGDQLKSDPSIIKDILRFSDEELTEEKIEGPKPSWGPRQPCRSRCSDPRQTERTGNAGSTGPPASSQICSRCAVDDFGNESQPGESHRGVMQRQHH